VKSRTFGATDGWRSQYRELHPDVGRSQGTASTAAWSNSRDAGEIIGLTARLHPQLRSCIDALGLEEGERGTVPDALLIRSSADDPVPLWGQLMRDNKGLRLRLALIGWAQGIDLETVHDEPIKWEEFLASEQVRRHVVQGGKVRDDKEGLARELDALQKRAAVAHPPNPDPRSGVRQMLGPTEWNELDDKYRLDDPVITLDQLDPGYLFDLFGLQSLLLRGKSVAPGTSLAPGLLSQGWHLVAPVQVLGWMVAQQVLGDTRGTAKNLGVKHLGLREGFRSADRARYFAKLSRQHRDLATLTLQRSIIWALADLGVIPETATDAGVPVQTMLVGQHQRKDCCVLISGDHLRLWYRIGAHWGREPSFLGRLPENFSMVTVGDDEVTLKGTRTDECPFPMTVTQLQLHTFPHTSSTFPAKAWARRTGLNPASVIPLVSSNVAGQVAR
jgi:hypothetical protein